MERLPKRISRYGYDILRSLDLFRANENFKSRPLALLGSHDLSLSGAPRIVLEMARALLSRDYYVVVVAMGGGPMRAEFEAAGAVVLIDVRPRLGSAYLRNLADTAQLAITNTVACAPLAQIWSKHVPLIWYLHEVSLLQREIARDSVRLPLGAAAEVWAGSELSAAIARTARPDVRIFPYGVDPLPAEPLGAIGDCLRVGVFGSIEPRKGQDLALAGIAALDCHERGAIRMRLFGRVLDRDFADGVLAQVDDLAEASFGGELDTQSYRRVMSEVDAVLVPSRDDTLPLVSIDALSAGRLLLLTRSVGTSEWLEDGRDAIIEPETDVAAIARLLRRALEVRPTADTMGCAARARFEQHFSRDAFLHTFYSRIDALRRTRE
ncbi:glycosyltransferase family 4 protein [Altererythrobacter sp. TH136]|uniref:glycosyltransferase family 4 protein n=1 Tax=Altererythrobacter sp. TH136 TaxID=2067415 RepID=UPI00143DF18A|nr:glycosyltransferase family 4 protein [Altererythrobacter sp. TH136]